MFSFATPCEMCGMPLAPAAHAGHECDPTVLADHRYFQLRDERARLEGAITDWLNSPQGRFETWLARRTIKETHP